MDNGANGSRNENDEAQKASEDQAEDTVHMYDGDLSPETAVEPGPPDWEAETKKFQDLYLRALAETENIKRRAKKEQEETCRYAAERLMKGLVPVLDNLHLALSYADPSIPQVKSLAEGVRMTLKGFLDFLGEQGFKEVEAEKGQAFDPNVHEALGQEPDPELQDMTIAREVAKGYILGTRVIRPAQVMVVKNHSI
ncbi:MAG: nucleotide exchange factor GrpE [Deltaproteobacteria bacterium]|jgi:molecular chaperone GrpE|nr:nucleotide exchange factor GrpE [Deltaproteobacteria bacterium]